MAQVKIGKPTEQDFEICYRFNSVLESLTDDRMYRCANESDWEDWNTEDEDYKVLSKIRDSYCQWADKDKKELDDSDHQQILWRYVKWFFNEHPSSLARIIMCANVAMDNAFDNSEEVTTIKWNKRCSEALDMWDAIHAENQELSNVDLAIDATIKVLEDKLTECVLLGVDKQTDAYTYRIRKDFIRAEAKQIIGQAGNNT